MNKITIIGLVIIVLGIGMLLFGASIFTYSGPPLNPIVSELGEFSFFCWLPAIFIGIVFIVWPKRRKKI